MRPHLANDPTSASLAAGRVRPNTRRIQLLTTSPTERNGRKSLTTVQGLPKKFDQKKILKAIKKKFGMYPLPQPIAALPTPLRLICAISAWPPPC